MNTSLSLFMRIKHWGRLVVEWLIFILLQIVDLCQDLVGSEKVPLVGFPSLPRQVFFFPFLVPQPVALPPSERCCRQAGNIVVSVPFGKKSICRKVLTGYFYCFVGQSIQKKCYFA